MAKIVVPDWLNENSLRAFPLKHKTNKEANTGYVVANNLLLDLQLNYDTAQSTIRLESIVKSSGSITLTFTGGKVFTTALPLTDKYVRTGSSLVVLGPGATTIPDGTHTFAAAEVDPQCVVKFYGKWKGVTSMTFGPGVPLTGNIELIEGLQTRINCVGQTLTIGASNLYGVSLGCDTFGDAPADCNTLISNVSGILPDGNNVIHLTAGEGMVVYDDPENHRIYIGFDFTDPADVCKVILPNPVV